MNRKTIMLFATSLLILAIFFTVKTLVLIDFLQSTKLTRGVEYACFLFFIPVFFMLVKNYLRTNSLNNQFKDLQNFVDKSVLVSKADARGKITYVNQKFSEVSGWKLEEVVGKDHKIVNSGMHPKEMWDNMYKTVIAEKKIWNAVIINKAKDGHLYWVDSYIKAEFNHKGELKGFMSLRYDISETIKNTNEIEKKNTYLEHAAKILRHDMHSGINTYIPRGVTSLERRLKPETIKELKLEAPLKMLKEGLKHTQKVYKGVYEFTNLVKKDVVLEKQLMDPRKALKEYLESTSYTSQVIIKDLIEIEINESLFCTAVDNLIRNGLKYNDSDTKWVKIYMLDENTLAIQDNGRGLSQEDFNHLSKPYTRKQGQKESGSGLGLNICKAILQEHGFDITCRKAEEGGTIMMINIKNKLKK